MKAKRRKKSGRTRGGFFLWWLLLIPVLTLLMAMLGGSLIAAGKLPETSALPLALTMTGLISLSLSLCSAITAPQKKLLWGLSAGVLYGLCLFLGNVLFFGLAWDHVLPVLGCVLGGGLLGGLLGLKKRKKYA